MMTDSIGRCCRLAYWPIPSARLTATRNRWLPLRNATLIAEPPVVPLYVGDRPAGLFRKRVQLAVQLGLRLPQRLQAGPRLLEFPRLLLDATLGERVALRLPAVQFRQLRPLRMAAPVLG